MQFMTTTEGSCWGYTVEARNCVALPSWTIAAVTRDIFGVNSAEPSLLKYYELPEPLSQVAAVADEELVRDSKAQLLPPPENWVVRSMAPDLFVSSGQSAALLAAAAEGMATEEQRPLIPSTGSVTFTPVLGGQAQQGQADPPQDNDERPDDQPDDQRPDNDCCWPW